MVFPLYSHYNTVPRGAKSRETAVKRLYFGQYSHCIDCMLVNLLYSYILQYS